MNVGSEKWRIQTFSTASLIINVKLDESLAYPLIKMRSTSGCSMKLWLSTPVLLEKYTTDIFPKLQIGSFGCGGVGGRGDFTNFPRVDLESQICLKLCLWITYSSMADACSLSLKLQNYLPVSNFNLPTPYVHLFCIKWGIYACNF